MWVEIEKSEGAMGGFCRGDDGVQKVWGRSHSFLSLG